MVESVVVWAERAVERFVAAFCGSDDTVTETYSGACLEFPIIKVQPGLFGWCPPAKTIANAAAGEEPVQMGIVEANVPGRGSHRWRW